MRRTTKAPGAAAPSDITVGYDTDPASSWSLHSDAYTDPPWFEIDQQSIMATTWQWLCHVERLREAGSYMAETIAGMPIVAVRGKDGVLRAFYNVCQHRAHELLEGSGVTDSIICPYHAWTYDLSGALSSARKTRNMARFDVSNICLSGVQVTEFGGFVYVNLDADAAPLAEQAGDLGDEIARWAPDVAELTHARRLTYEVSSNWKNLVDNFLECYHCHIAHPAFVSLVDMSTYQVTTHGIYSSHMAKAGTTENAAYDVAEATVREHAVWWLWPNTCLLRYPGRGNLMVLRIIPVGIDRTVETLDFFLEDAEPNEAEIESIRFMDEVLQVEDISLVESVQRGMSTPGFDQGRIVFDPKGSGLSEHGVHHFHGLVLDAYRAAGEA